MPAAGAVRRRRPVTIGGGERYLAMARSHPFLARIMRIAGEDAHAWARDVRKLPGAVRPGKLDFGVDRMRAVAVPLSYVRAAFREAGIEHP